MHCGGLVTWSSRTLRPRSCSHVSHWRICKRRNFADTPSNRVTCATACHERCTTIFRQSPCCARIRARTRMSVRKLPQLSPRNIASHFRAMQPIARVLTHHAKSTSVKAPLTRFAMFPFFTTCSRFGFWGKCRFPVLSHPTYRRWDKAGDFWRETFMEQMVNWSTPLKMCDGIGTTAPEVLFSDKKQQRQNGRGLGAGTG